MSQRTHKCTAQPPGDLVRQSDLVQRLMSRSSAPKAPEPDATAPPVVQPSSPKPVIQFSVQSQPLNNSNLPVMPQQLQLHSQEPLLTINEESLRQLLAIFPPNWELSKCLYMFLVRASLWFKDMVKGNARSNIFCILFSLRICTICLNFLNKFLFCWLYQKMFCYQ